MAYKDLADPRNVASKRRHYERNRERYIAQAKAAKQALVDEVRAIKESTPCADCGERHPYYVMQFDHIGDDKVADIARLLYRGAGRPTVLAEIAKCEVVCANCHAVRTWKRLQE